MFGEVVAFLHRNVRILVLATPAIVLAAGAMLEFSRLTH
ncbi:hypothetical protein BH09PSE1_BH09PSE1_11490 [soil metagenome]